MDMYMDTIGVVLLQVLFGILNAMKFRSLKDLSITEWVDKVSQNEDLRLSGLFRPNNERPILFLDYIKDKKEILQAIALAIFCEIFGIAMVLFFENPDVPTHSATLVILILSFAVSIAISIAAMSNIGIYRKRLGGIEANMAFIFLNGSRNDFNNAIIRIDDHEGHCGGLIHLMAKELDKNGHVNSRESALWDKV